MPNGTIQDSRMPQSPQWGYLEIEEDDMVDYKEGKGEYLDTGRTGGRPWNKYVLYVNDQQKQFLLRQGDRVKFEMVECDLMGINVWVAVISEKMDQAD